MIDLPGGPAGPASGLVRWIAAGAALLLWAGSAVPGRAQDRVVEDVVVEQSRIIERFSPPPVKGSASLRVPTLADRMPAELAAQRSLVLRNVRIEGATALTPDDLRPLWADMVGREIPVADLFALTARIEQRYLAAGILTVATVPVQDLADGDVRVVVFDQSFIRTVETRGDDPGLRRRLDPHIARLVAMQPLRIRRIERILLLMSDIAGMNIEASLRRPEVPGNGGGLTLDIAFEKRVVRASLDNRGTDEVGPIQAFGTYQENDLLGLFESTTLTGATIPNQPRELLFGQLSQDLPVGGDGLHVGYRVDAASSRPGGELGSLDVEVASFTGEVYASYPVLRTIAHSVWTNATLTARNTDVDIGGQTQSRDRYRWLSAGLASEHDLSIGALDLRAEYLQGIGLLDATGEGSALASRTAAETEFQVATAGAAFSAGLFERVGLVASLAGQYAFGPLPGEVQLSFGGEPYGRAFDNGAVSGDSGILGSLELAVDTNVPVDIVLGSAVYGFVDYGALWYRGDDRGDARSTTGSAGLGLRAALEGGFAVDTTLAVPIDTGDAEDPGTRVFLSLKKRF